MTGSSSPPRDGQTAAPSRPTLRVLPGGAAEPTPGPHPALRLVRPAERPLKPPEAPAAGPGATRPGAACRLHVPAPGPTSSAPGLRRRWVLEFEPTRRQEPDRLIGWIGGADPLSQVRLEFPTREAALAYARRRGLACEAGEPRRRRVAPRPFAENFLAPEPDAWSELLLAA